MSLAAGMRIGVYEIVSALGAGRRFEATDRCVPND